MGKEVNIARSKLFSDGMLHIEFLDGSSYLYSLQEIIDTIAGVEKDEALQMAFEEMDDIQFIDNTWQEASVSKAEAKEILRKLADRLTKRALDKVPVRIGDPCSKCGGCDVQCAECLAALCQ